MVINKLTMKPANFSSKETKCENRCVLRMMNCITYQEVYHNKTME